VLVAVGVLLLVGAWWRARRSLDELAPSALVRATALWSLPLLVAPPLFSRDVYSYAGQALLAARGTSPYEQGPSAAPGEISAEVDDVWLDTPSPYGPAFLGPASLLLRLTGDDVVPAVLLLRLLAVLGLVLTAVALPVLARACGVPAQRALWLGLANPLGLLHGVGGAHNDALMVGLLVAGAAVALRGDVTAEGRDPPRSPTSDRGATRPSTRALLAAGALVALAGLVKAPAFGALPFLALAVPGLRERLRAVAALALGAVTAAVAATV
jgi:alpha-1,6-mannosyltransferase